MLHGPSKRETTILKRGVGGVSLVQPYSERARRRALTQILQAGRGRGPAFFDMRGVFTFFCGFQPSSLGGRNEEVLQVAEKVCCLDFSV